MQPPVNLTLVATQGAVQPSGESDDTLMWRCKTGDRRAFAQLVQRHESAVRRLCLLLLRDDAQARDVAQDSFIQLWNLRQDYAPEEKLKALLLTIARNRCRSALRRRRVASLFVTTERQEAIRWASDAGQSMEERERQMIIAAAVERLPEKFRLPLVLRFIDELPYEDIAKIIGRTESAARSRVHYALKSLADLLPEGARP